jgi:hypothetical protein
MAWRKYISQLEYTVALTRDGEAFGKCVGDVSL